MINDTNWPPTQQSPAPTMAISCCTAVGKVGQAQPGSYLVDVEFAAEMKRANKVRSKIEFLQV